ncbi:response regulator transcription factor [Pigmentiphaga sp.]|jgi:Response regulator|uniref:response regulator transcription factor n=1 Tax=Pigmentiphaga sp. TaxID=1977564 RepID=UPI0025E22416|nr:helix-turn-helix transcriptional regulator [Pigmentiphaga sp.]MBX6317319.1 helix-turn-helix transcriptional regulator [Pigmentiphaga sp.]
MESKHWEGDGQDRRQLLTPREREVMDLLIEGRANKVIADRLGISIRTVEVHRARVLAKLGARNAVELVWRLVSSQGMDAPGAHVAEGGPDHRTRPPAGHWDRRAG